MKKIRAFMAGAAVMAALVVSSPATAGTPTAAATGQVSLAMSCPYYHLCVWENAYYGGRQVNFEFSNTNWSNLSSTLRFIVNNDQSWYNNGAPGAYGHARVYGNTGYGGMTICLPPGYGVDYTVSTWINNNGQSNNWGSSC